MQSHPPARPRVFADPPQLKSRPRIRYVAWSGLLLGVLRLLARQSLGLLQLLLSAIGIYVSWEDVTTRRFCLAFYVAGCFVWTVLETFYLLILIAASWSFLHDVVVGLVIPNTFPNLSTALDNVFDILAKDTDSSDLFSAFSYVLIAALTCSWALSLYVDVVEALALSFYLDAIGAAASSDVFIPVSRPIAPPERRGIAGPCVISETVINSTPQLR